MYIQGGSSHAGEEWTGGSTWTYDVTGADLLQVIDWAQRRAGDASTYSIALVVDAPTEQLAPGDGRGLVWLVGVDGKDDGPGLWPLTDAQRRMLARRQHPVVLGSDDRMPSD